VVAIVAAIVPLASRRRIVAAKSAASA